MLIAYFLACALPNGSLVVYREKIYQVADSHTHVNLPMTVLELVPTHGADPRIVSAYFRDTAIMEVHIPLM